VNEDKAELPSARGQVIFANCSRIGRKVHPTQWAVPAKPLQGIVERQARQTPRPSNTDVVLHLKHHE
jgi:hypothetical protein